MVKYTVILEKGDSNWSAYVPDLPGCVAAARSAAETKSLIREAIGLHLELMRADGDPIPAPTTRATVVAVSS
jgi:predicted RNase H-like HicB family nuclease